MPIWTMSSDHYDVIKWKHFPRIWPFVRGIHRSPVNSPHKGQWRGALMFSLICVWINDWVKNREVGDLRHYCAHNDVMVMVIKHMVPCLSRCSLPRITSMWLTELLSITFNLKSLYISISNRTSLAEFNELHNNCYYVTWAVAFSTGNLYNNTKIIRLYNGNVVIKVTF